MSEPEAARVSTADCGRGPFARRILACGAAAAALWAGPLGAQTSQPASTKAAAPPLPQEAAATRVIEAGKPREALDQLDRAIASLRRAGDRPGLVRVHVRRSGIRLTVGDRDAAAHDAAEAQTHAGDDPALLVSALNQMGRVEVARLAFDAAAAALRKALSLAETLGDARAEASVLRTMTVLEDRRGRALDALAFLQRATAAADRAGDALLRVQVRGNAVGSLLELARYDAALAMAEEAAQIAEQSGATAVRGSALLGLAQTHAHMWNLDRAAELWPRAIEANRQAGNRVMVALVQKQSVETWFALGDYERAAAEGEKAVELLRETGQTHLLAETLARVALSHVRQGRTADARIWADRARAELAAAPEARHHYVHNDLGIVETELGDLVRARADYARVADVAHKLGNVEYRWRAWWGDGRVALRERPADAVAPLEQAIAMVERLRQTIPAAAQRASFMINRVGPYETLVEAYMASASSPSDARVARALEVAERARGRALADLLAEARARLTDARVAAVREEETAFGRRFSAVQQRVFGASEGAARTAALQELHALEREYETLVSRIRRDNPAYAALAHPAALSASDLSTMLAPDEALLEFLVTESQGYAWVVRRDATIGYAIPGRTALDRQVRLMTALVNARDDEGTRQLGERLFSALLGPARATIEGARRLVVVPDGVLQRLPFALLRSNGRWLVETHTLSVAPSATILHRLRQSPRAPAPRPLLALAAPGAPPTGHRALFDRGSRALGVLAHAVAEVDSARRLVGADRASTYTGAAATEAILKSAEAGRHRIVHLAAHAIADEIVPRRSAVLLTPQGQEDGLLQVSEIANLTLNADLVVLAACRSHVGRLVRGEGLLSLSRAFIHAGARAVVATTWTVPDRETAWLMRRFYAAMGDGLAPDAALQRAQVAALESGGVRAAPGTWGAFVLMGEGRAPILDPQEPSSAWNPVLAGGILFALGGAMVLLRRSHRTAPRGVTAP